MTYTGIAEGNVTVIGYGAAYSHSNGGSGFGISIGVAGVGVSFSATFGNSMMWQGSGTRTY